jgi:hypothetical protein
VTDSQVILKEIGHLAGFFAQSSVLSTQSLAETQRITNNLLDEVFKANSRGMISHPGNGRCNICWKEKKFVFGAPCRVHVKIYFRPYRYQHAKLSCRRLWQKTPDPLFAIGCDQSVFPLSIVVWMSAAGPIR